MMRLSVMVGELKGGIAFRQRVDWRCKEYWSL